MEIVLLENVPRATGQGLIFAECMKHGKVKEIEYDPSSVDMFGNCHALVTFEDAEGAKNTVMKLSKRKTLFGSEMPIEVRLVSEEEAASMKPPEPDMSISEEVSRVTMPSDLPGPADIAESGLQIRERVKDRTYGREAYPQEPRADDVDRYQRQERRPRERVREPREERVREPRQERGRYDDRNADVDDGYHRQDRQGGRRRFEERSSNNRESRPQQDDRRRRDHRGRGADDLDRNGPADHEGEPARPPRKRRAPAEQGAGGSDSGSSSGGEAPPPKEVKRRGGMSGFDKKEPAAGTEQALVPGSAAAILAGPQVVTRGNWAEISATPAAQPYYGNLMTGAKQLSRPAEFGPGASQVVTNTQGGVLGIRGTAMNSNVYVGMMPPGITDPDFRSLFAPYGAIMSTRLMGTRNGGVCGFVKYTSYHEAQMAINSMNGMAIHGTKLKVKLADQDNLGFNPAMLRLQQTTGLPMATI